LVNRNKLKDVCFLVQEEEFQQTVSALLEMFPYSCALEVTHCLQLMAGDVERATQIIMHRHEDGQDLKPTDRKVRLGTNSK
jgi:hypothetical protein